MTAREVHLTTAELAARWKTTPNAIRIMRSRGKAPESIQLASRHGHLYPLAVVEEFERRQLGSAPRMTAAQAAPYAA